MTRARRCSLYMTRQTKHPGSGPNSRRNEAGISQVVRFTFPNQRIGKHSRAQATSWVACRSSRCPTEKARQVLHGASRGRDQANRQEARSINRRLVFRTGCLHSVCRSRISMKKSSRELRTTALRIKLSTGDPWTSLASRRPLRLGSCSILNLKARGSIRGLLPCGAMAIAAYSSLPEAGQSAHKGI